MKPKRLRPIAFALLALILASLACELPNTAKPVAAITFPATGTTMVKFQEVTIISAISADAGVERVELYINGILVRSDSPPDGNPTSFIAEQPWIPTEEGATMIGVVAYDAKGNSSETNEVSVIVAAATGELQTTPSPETPQETPPSGETPGACTKQATFLADVTIPVNAYITAGWSFTKTWRVQNTGTCTWEGYSLVFISGDLMGGVTPKGLPLVAPNATSDISIDLIAPNYPGTYTATWRLRAPDGAIFGPDLMFLINVPAVNTDTPAPTNTALPTFTPTFTKTFTPTHTATTAPPTSGQVSTQITVPAGSVGYKTVSCPAGSVVTSGGFALTNGLWFYNSTKNGNGWRVYAKNDTGSGLLMNIYAMCLYNSGGTTASILSQANAAPNTYTRGEAVCPSGSTVVGGGFINGSDGALELYNSSKSGNGWQIYVNNITGTQKLFNTYAICLSGASGSTTQVQSSQSVPAGSIGHGVTACPGSSVLTGGGFAVNLSLYIYNMSATGNSWQNYARNPLAVDKLMFTYATCYSP